MTSISKNIYIDNLDHIVNKYNNRSYHKIMKMNANNAKYNMYIYIYIYIKQGFDLFKQQDVSEIMSCVFEELCGE